MTPTDRWYVLALCVAFTQACGARTGLRVVPTDASPDSPTDAAVTPACRPLRVRTRVGTPVSLRVEVDHVTPRSSGFVWSLRQAPRRSRATVESTGADTVNLTPDVEGEYDLSVTTPYRLAGGALLSCSASVIADPADPLCPGYALQEPITVALPQGDMQFAFEPSWSTPRVNAGSPGETSLVAADHPGANVAALILDTPNFQDLEAFASQTESAVANALGATAVLVGREGSSSEGYRYRRASFRVTTVAPTTADVVRDRIAREVGRLMPGAPAAGFSASRDFVMELTVVARPDASRAVILYAVAPEALFENPTSPTASRLQDVTNATGLARRDRALDVVCQRITATRNVTADFLWLVDTSASMDDDQERLGLTARRFFKDLNTAGIDFRVGVVQAGSREPIDLENPGFSWVSGRDPDGPRQLAFQVTYRQFQEDRSDTLSPYPLDGSREEPLAAGVITTTEMERRASTDPDDRRRFRAGATRVAFFVSDEAGTNDDTRYFALDRLRWGPTFTERFPNVVRWYRDHAFLTFGLVNVFARSPCPAANNFVPCLITANGGAYIPIGTATDAEVSSALSRIVDAIAGASSEFVLTAPPVSSTLRVRVGERLAPRSRADGFDYDEAARTIVFRGITWRPRAGEDVRAAYFLWR